MALATLPGHETARTEAVLPSSRDDPQAAGDPGVRPAHPRPGEAVSDLGLGGAGHEGVQMALAWFPSEQWAGALARWPDLLQDNPEDHAAYSRKIQETLLRFASATANPLSVAALDLGGLIEYSSRRGYDPGSSAARSAYAAELARTGRARRWPPGRNEGCWCGSGRKYKACCGTVSLPP